MSKGLIDTLLDGVFDAEWKGRYGEKLTARELKLVKLFGRDGKILRNVYVPKDDGETSEIDVIFITQKGVFGLESKNYSGWIFGNEDDSHWTVSLPGGHKERFYSPIRQNRSHVKWLGEYLGGEVPLFSVIVFSERCELKKVTLTSGDVPVVKRDRLYATVRELWDAAPDAVDEAGVDALYDRLLPLTKVSEAEKAEHVANIEEHYKFKPKGAKPADKPAGVRSAHTTAKPVVESAAHDTTAAPAAQDGEPLVCPRCGAALVLRTAKKGANAGNRFLGCSNYPKCRYIRDL